MQRAGGICLLKQLEEGQDKESRPHPGASFLENFGEKVLTESHTAPNPMLPDPKGLGRTQGTRPVSLMVPGEHVGPCTPEVMPLVPTQKKQHVPEGPLVSAEHCAAG